MIKYGCIVLFIAFISDCIYKNFFEPKPVQVIQKEPEQPIYNENQYKQTYKKMKNENNDEEQESDFDDDEFDVPINVPTTIKVKIVYDPKHYNNTQETYAKYLRGNYTTKIHVECEEFEIPKKKFILSKVVFGSEIFFTVFIFGITYLKSLVPNKIFDKIYSLRTILGIISFIIHQYLLRQLTSTWAFEVFINDKLHFSSLKDGTVVNYVDIIKVINRILS